MNAAYAIALQLVDGEILPAKFEAAELNRDELWKIIEKVECRPSDEFHLRWAQRAIVTFDDRQTLTAMVDGPRGVEPPLSNDEILQKWQSATNGILDAHTRQSIEATILGLEEVPDLVMELTRILR